MDRRAQAYRFRRTRQWTAYRRRSPIRRARAACASAVPMDLNGLGALPPQVLRWMCAIAERARAYPWVWACLVRHRSDRWGIYLHVPRPMTTPMARLAGSWIREIEAVCPGCGLTVEVGDAPPPNPDLYRVLFRRPRAAR